ncbi:MAG: helix-turn-helix transcriptional regulator [Pseudomonadota bacterium]
MSNFSNRLKYAIHNYAMGAISYKSFAGLVDIPYRTLQNYLSGDRSPNLDALEKFANTGLNVHWLVTGKGVPYMDDVLETNYVDKIFLACADDIVNKCLGSSNNMFEESEKIRIISFMMSRNYLGLGETLRYLLNEGYFKSFAEIEDMINKGDIPELHPKLPETSAEMQEFLQLIKHTMKKERGLKPPKFDE